MEIISPAMLWKDFNRLSLPLDVTKLYTKEIDGYRVTALYFSSIKTSDGEIRVYARLYEPLHIKNTTVIIYFNDIEKSIESKSTLREAMEDYSFLCIDYAGKKEDRQRFTIFPKSLEKLNYFDYPDEVNSIPIDIKQSIRYILAATAMRAVTLIETEFPHTSNIGIVGVGLGGCSVMMACSFENKITAGMTIYSSGYIADNGKRPIEFTAFKAALDCESYAPFLRSPVLQLITSNERNGSMEYMTDIFKKITLETSRLSIVERTSRSVSVKQRKNCKFWFDYYTKNIGSLPLTPSIKANGSEGKLYIEAQIDKQLEIDSLELFVSYGVRNPSFRNWNSIKMEITSEKDYLAVVPVYDSASPVYAFVNVKYKNSISISSKLLTIIPVKLGIKGEEIKPTRLIYDSDMELDDWTLISDSGTDEIVKISMATGPFDISGVSSSTGNLTTYKISEPMYKSYKDSSLQLLVYSSEAQDVEFKITSINDEGDAIDYSLFRRLSPQDNWKSLTFSSVDFRSSTGVLEHFRTAVTFEINSTTGKVIVSSMLWV